MADVPNFPDCCEITLVNRKIKPKNDAYFRTASRDHVDLIKKLECKHCLEKERPEKTFSVAKPAVIAACGHYVHMDCRFVSDDSKEQFRCNECRTKPDSIKGYVSDHAVFTDFFKHIEEDDGFECLGCSKLHPKGNVVRIYGDEKGSRNGKSGKYLCVWCASEDRYKNHWLGLVGHSEPVDKPDRQSMKLHSVDREFSCSKYLNLQCCSCMTAVIWLPLSVREMHGTDDEIKTAYLQCGHIRCEECNVEDRVYCNLCYRNNIYTVEDAKGWARRCHIQKYLTSYAHNKGDGFILGSECAGCKKSHPNDNIKKYIFKKDKCMWCNVRESRFGKSNWEEAQKNRKKTNVGGIKYEELTEDSSV